MPVNKFLWIIVKKLKAIFSWHYLKSCLLIFITYLFFIQKSLMMLKQFLGVLVLHYILVVFFVMLAELFFIKWTTAKFIHDNSISVIWTFNFIFLVFGFQDALSFFVISFSKALQMGRKTYFNSIYFASMFMFLFRYWNNTRVTFKLSDNSLKYIRV